MAFKKTKGFGGFSQRPASRTVTPQSGGDHSTDGLSDLYSKGRMPLQRHFPGTIQSHNTHGAPGGPPPGLRRKSQDPAAQTQRFPFGGGTTPGARGRSPSEPAEPHQAYGFDPEK